MPMIEDTCLSRVGRTDARLGSSQSTLFGSAQAAKINTAIWLPGWLPRGRWALLVDLRRW